VTRKTRRLLFFSVLVAALTLPAEAILLRAISTPDQSVAIQNWAAAMDATSLNEAAARIQTYPFKYRQAIMRQLSPAQRSDVWRQHMRTYIEQHPNLDPAAVDAINAAAELASPSYLDEPTAEAREALHAAADRIVSLLGREEAEYLMFYLGPKDGTFASFEPLAMKITNTVREMFTLHAFVDRCDCAMYFGCADWRFSCVNWTHCSQDPGWPQCGWLWEDPCDGGCAA
jgi:hypothetical protein